MGFPVDEHMVFKPDGGTVDIISPVESKAIPLANAVVGEVVRMKKAGQRRFPFGIDIPLVMNTESGQWTFVGLCMVTGVSTNLVGGKKGKIETDVTAEITRIFTKDQQQMAHHFFPWADPQQRIK